MSLGNLYYKNISTFLKASPNSITFESLSNKHLLFYLFFTSTQTQISNLTTIKNQDLIVKIPKSADLSNKLNIFNISSYYRKHKEKIYKAIVTKNGLEYITNEYDGETLEELDISKFDYYVVKPDFIIKKKNIIIHHASNSKLGSVDDDSEYNYKPYNYIGNWFSEENPATLFGYTGFDQPRIYKYKLKKDINILNLESEDSPKYFKNHIMLLKTLINNNTIFNITTQTRSHCMQRENGRGFKSDADIPEEFKEKVEKFRKEKDCEDPSTSKFNYSSFRNLKDISKPSPAGLHIFEKAYDLPTNKLKDTVIIELKTASSGDGDKVLSSELCHLLHNKNDDDYTIEGWDWDDLGLQHLMICDTKHIELIGALKDLSSLIEGPPKFLNKGTPEFNEGDYFKKYLKYKNKYLQLKKDFEKNNF